MNSIREYVVSKKQADPVDYVDGIIYAIVETVQDGDPVLELGIPANLKQLDNGKHSMDWYRCTVRDPDRQRMIQTTFKVGDRVRVVGREWHRTATGTGWTVLLESTAVGDLYEDPGPGAREIEQAVSNPTAESLLDAGPGWEQDDPTGELHCVDCGEEVDSCACESGPHVGVFRPAVL